MQAMIYNLNECACEAFKLFCGGRGSGKHRHNFRKDRDWVRRLERRKGRLRSCWLVYVNDTRLCVQSCVGDASVVHGGKRTNGGPGWDRGYCCPDSRSSPHLKGDVCVSSG